MKTNTKFKFEFKSKLNMYNLDDGTYTLFIEFIATGCNTVLTTVITVARGEGGKDNKGRCDGDRADAERADGDSM